MKILKWPKKIKNRWRCQYREEPAKESLRLTPTIDAGKIMNCAGKIMSITSKRHRRPLSKEEKENVNSAWREIINIASKHLEFGAEND